MAGEVVDTTATVAPGSKVQLLARACALPAGPVAKQGQGQEQQQRPGLQVRRPPARSAWLMSLCQLNNRFVNSNLESKVSHGWSPGWMPLQLQAGPNGIAGIARIAEGRPQGHALPPLAPLALQVLFEDDHLAVVVKPPGLPTQGAGVGACGWCGGQSEVPCTGTMHQQPASMCPCRSMLDEAPNWASVRQPVQLPISAQARCFMPKLRAKVGCHPSNPHTCRPGHPAGPHQVLPGPMHGARRPQPPPPRAPPCEWDGEGEGEGERV